MKHGAQRLLGIERNTADLARAVAFHRDGLGFTVEDAAAAPPAWTLLRGACAAPPRCARLSLGAQSLLLTEFPRAAPCPADSACNDSWFQHCAIVVDDMSTAFKQAMQHGAVAITQGGPQTLAPSTGSVTAFKFRDPDGHPLELIALPPGTGDPAWQAARAPHVALGIDHSAISVADVERSIRFYRSSGLHVAARGVNRGIAQQRLDQLQDVQVDVVALQPADARTPHLELLGYRQPRGRVRAAADITAIASDRLAWQVDAIDPVLDAMASAGCAPQLIARGCSRGRAVALLRDPDGHALVMIEAA